ncbi:MAG: hypothetical protein K2K89_08480 [Ruminococcus sp.]|nr:hypothetical protein [Ruminococcus sp.]
MRERPSNNPWDYTLISSDGNVVLNNTLHSFCVGGDIRSNGDTYLNKNDFYIDGDVVTSGLIFRDSLTIDIGESFTGVDMIDVTNKWDNVYSVATESGDYEYIAENIKKNSLELEKTAISESDLYIDISSDIVPDTDLSENSGKGKVGVFGAGYLASAYENYDKWKTIIPLFENDINLSEDSSGKRDLLELAEKSGFIPIREQEVDNKWNNYEKLPRAAINENFSSDGVSQYINKIKQNNPVFETGNKNPVQISGTYSNDTINPTEASAESIVVNGGNFALNGNYENLKEIKLENGGGAQLIGDFPNLKYIYKTSWSNLNLAGNFPSLECIYMPGGQLLLGTADKGFSADNATIINENGSVVVYTAQDINITNSEILSNQNILMRGAGKDAVESEFNAENTLMAAESCVMFEDMNDFNLSRYEKLPVFYSQYPISLINCKFRLMQGLFMVKSGAIIMAASDIDTMRGFLVAQNGINEYQASSSTGFYIDTYSYNIPTGIHSLNKQPDGSERIGRISGVEYADFPTELLSKVGDAEKFLEDIQVNDVASELGHMTTTPGLLKINASLLSYGDININAGKIENDSNAKSVISSRNGNITINIAKEMNYHGIIYAPNGKVTINGEGNIYGRIFAREIEVTSDSFMFEGRNIDIESFGFTQTESVTTQPTEVVSTTEITSATTQQVTTISNITETSSSSETSSTTTITTEFTTPVDYSSNVKYEYDNLNRVIKAIYDEENYVIYEYDANGNITKVTVVKDGIIQ